METLTLCLFFPSACLVAGLAVGHHSQKVREVDPRVCILAILVLLLGIFSLTNSFQSVVCRVATS